MTDNELKKLSKTQLYELLHRQELEIERLASKNKELDQRHLNQEQAGSLADASIEVSGIIQAAQKAADVYLSNIRAMEDSSLMKAGELAGDEKVLALRAAEYKNAQLRGGLESLIKDLIRTFNSQLSSYSEMKVTLSELIENNDLGHLLPKGEREAGRS